MARKFVYSPGLPGYGTKGVDGSAGLTGIATYFSSYDGASDTVTIKSKIISNKELFSNDKLIPGYPTRKYQNGDIFIDRNARIYQIDFAEGNKYKDTGIFLNTSGFFSSGPLQASTPTFQRYSNQYSTEKYLIDSVYSNDVGDYTTYPTSIYDESPLYYGRISFVDQDLSPDFTNYFPFNVWSIGSIDNADSIALVRDLNQNSWRFGNLNSGLVRDVSLFLDFGDVFSSGDLHVESSLYVSGNIQFTNSINYIKGEGIEIHSTDNLVIQTEDSSIFPSDIILQAADSIKGSSGTPTPGEISILSGNGGNNTSGSGARGGDIIANAGDAGSGVGNNTTPQVGRTGGSLNFSAGIGGDMENIGPGYAETGSGGEVSIIAGDAFLSSFRDRGGDGGSVSIHAGEAASGSVEGGKGGSLTFSAGDGGGGGGINGDGGDITLTPGGASSGASNGKIILNGQTLLQNGSATSPSFAFTGSGSNTGIYSSATDRINFSIDGTNRFEMLYSGGINILELNGTSSIRNATTSVAGSNLEVKAGNSVNSSGGNLGLLGGNALTGNGSGGDIELGGGVAVGSGIGGEVVINGGDSWAGAAGDIVIQAGTVGDSTSFGQGGDVKIYGGGGGNFPGSGGDIDIKTADSGQIFITTVGTDVGNIIIDSTWDLRLQADKDIEITPGAGGDVKFSNINSVSTTTNMEYLMLDTTSSVLYSHTNTPSDIKYKNIIGNIENALSGILAINGYNFTWNDQSKELFDEVNHEELQFGFVAQEVELVFPHAVKNIINEKRNIEYKRVDYEKFTAIFAEAIKEQQSEIENLKDIVSKQQDQINKLLELNNLK